MPVMPAASFIRSDAEAKLDLDLREDISDAGAKWRRDRIIGYGISRLMCWGKTRSSQHGTAGVNENTVDGAGTAGLWKDQLTQ